MKAHSVVIDRLCSVSNSITLFKKPQYLLSKQQISKKEKYRVGGQSRKNLLLWGNRKGMIIDVKNLELYFFAENHVPVALTC